MNNSKFGELQMEYMNSCEYMEIYMYLHVFNHTFNYSLESGKINCNQKVKWYLFVYWYKLKYKKMCVN